jgi:argininosuccinate lyase
MKKLWQTDSSNEPDTGADSIRKKVESFTVGNDHLLDQYLLPFDLEASGVHVKALEAAGILTSEEAKKLQEGLSRILKLWEDGEFEINPEHEDGHTAIEVWLTAHFGDLGKKIHTGRSRNDQVLTAVRLYEKTRLNDILNQISTCAQAILGQANDHESLPMPGYTHTRKAMLSTAGQWLAGYAELMVMQLEASSGVKKLVNRSPLGTAAGFGTTISLDRDSESDLLGFEQPLVTATSAQLSRGWVELQVVQYLSNVTSLMSRFASDIIQFSSEAYGFIDIDETYCTGSSIMPNKKNPDVAELIRGKHALLAGYEATLQRITANLGSGYHRDLQLTKEPVIEAFNTTSEILALTELLVNGLSFNESALREACSNDLLAAERAYKLVKEEDMNFRDAYRKIKSESSEDVSIELADLFKTYSQLGSPGNIGIERLMKQVTKFEEGLQ